MTEDEIRASLPEHLARCGVPGDIVRHLMEPERPTRATAAVRAWLPTEELSLVLVGGNGCGKSHAASIALAENRVAYKVFREKPGDLPPDWRWNGGCFCDVRRQLGDVKASYEHVVAVRGRATETSMLVLDDLGLEKGDGEEAIWSVLSDRIAHGRRTVLTSNLSEANFRARYGGRLLSRLLGSGRLCVVHGPDLRLGPPAPRLSGQDRAAGVEVADQ